MANYDNCIEWVLRFEDSTLSGRITNDSDGMTRFGMLDRWHPELVAQGFYTCDATTALVLAKASYRIQYWNPIHGDDIQADVVAAQLLSSGVNDGYGTAIRLLQKCLGLKEDGILGPLTLAAVNGQEPQVLVQQLTGAQIQLYEDIVAREPAKEIYLNGWKRRANTIYPNHF